MGETLPLVALKCKLGELEAVLEIRDAADAHIRLIVELLDSVGPDGRLLPALVRAAVRFAGFGRTLWVDTTWLTTASPLVRQPGGVFEYLDNVLETAILNEHGLWAAHLPGVVPVVPLAASDEVLGRVRLLIEHLDRDVVIRIHKSQLRPQELVDGVQRVIRMSGVRPDHAHALLDAGFIDAVPARGVVAVSQAAAALADLLGPGSTTLLAGSIPERRTTYATTVKNRPEVFFWDEARLGRVADISYGDYGVTHPRPPARADNPRNPYPYLCYTVPRQTVVLRRRKAEDDNPAELFTDIADELVERDDFAGPGYSWGDDELWQCRSHGSRSAGAAPKWVAMATSHHLQHVARRALRGR